MTGRPAQPQFDYLGTFNQEVLLDELLVAFPSWVETVPGRLPERMLRVTLLRTEPGVTLFVPLGTNKNRVDAVIAAHDPTKLTYYEKATIAHNVLVASLKAKLTSPPGLTEAEFDLIKLHLV